MKGRSRWPAAPERPEWRDRRAAGGGERPSAAPGAPVRAGRVPAAAGPGGQEHAPPLETVVRSSLPVDLRLTLFPLRRGVGDPAVRAEPGGAWWRATRTPESPATTRFEPRPGDREVRVLAWGPGARWALDAAPGVIGACDRLDGFSPGAGPVRELHRRMPGLRITRSLAVFEALLPSILEQKVAGLAARRSYRELVRAWSEPAPGPGRLMLPPAPAAVAARAYFEFHPFGIEMRRANAIRHAAARAGFVEGATGLSPAEAERRLRSLPGVGPWTAAEVAIVALGDADAVSVGDYHLPHQVAWVMTGEPRGTDERMLELLEPFAGHRGRVLRLISSSGLSAPRRGPRMPLRSFRSS